MATSRPSPLIRFAALSFDPLTERPVVPEFGQGALPPDSGPVRTIVQFQHPAQPRGSDAAQTGVRRCAPRLRARLRVHRRALASYTRPL
jgi:hypothetical protein